MDTSNIYIDIADAIGMSHEDFASLTAGERWYYFHQVHDNIEIVEPF